MNYVFEKASLTLTPDNVDHKKWLDVVNVGLEVISNNKPIDPGIPNPLLNGKYVIKGVLDQHCLPNRSPINTGSQGVLKLSKEGRYALLPVLFIERLDIIPAGSLRCYSWYFGGISKPVDDGFGLLPGSCQGEISLDDLLEEIGANREMMDQVAVKFDSEGGFCES
jgi:hypothetical protein